MIGMVNAAGSAQAQREHPAARQTNRQPTTPDVGEPPMWVREPRGATDDAESARAVAAAKFEHETPPERQAPSGEQSTEVSRSETQAHTQQGVGQFLDTIA
ncbi:MAG: hypothetical protein H6817_06935 [Phycisphaerales bacterium]|nr:hypothetical protein [Phycisphaerales bacterium]